MKRFSKVIALVLMMVMVLLVSVGYAQTPTPTTPQSVPPKITKLNTKIVKEMPLDMYVDIMFNELGKAKKEVLTKLELKTEVAYLEEDIVQPDPNFKEIRLLNKDKKLLGRLVFKRDKLVMVNGIESYKDEPASDPTNSSRHGLQEDWSYARFDLLKVPGATNTIDRSDTTIIDEITFKNDKGIINHVIFIDYLDNELNVGITTLDAYGYLDQQAFDEVPKG